MPDQDALLVAAWKEAAAQTTEAEKRMDAAYTRFFDGEGPEQTDADRDRMRTLQALELECLERAVRYRGLASSRRP